MFGLDLIMDGLGCGIMALLVLLASHRASDLKRLGVVQWKDAQFIGHQLEAKTKILGVILKECYTAGGNIFQMVFSCP